jgi:hypothetical protein
MRREKRESAGGLDRRAPPAQAPSRRSPAVARWRLSGFEKPEPGNFAPRGNDKPLTRERPASWIETSRTASAFMQRQKSVIGTRCKH